MALLELRFGDIIMRVAKFLYDDPVVSGWDGSNPSDTKYQTCKQITLDGYQRFLGDFPWAFLDKDDTLTTWATVTGTSSGSPTSVVTTTGTTTAAAPVYDWPHSTIIAGTSTFSESMVGDPLAIAGDVAGTYYIDEYVSATTVRVIGDASGEGNSKGITVTHRVAYSTVTATAAKFFASMEGQTFTFDTSGTDYPIYKYVSTTVIWVEGDASGETSGDTFTVTANGDYALPDDFGDLISSFSYDSSNSYPRLVERTPEFIRERRSLEAGSASYPRYYAIQAKAQGPTREQHWELALQPAPASSFTMSYGYKITPARPDNFTDILLGGPQHNMTILQAAFAQVEIHRGDTVGPQNVLYEKTHLPRSIRINNEKKPRNLGPRRGRTDRADLRMDHQHIEVIHTLS